MLEELERKTEEVESINEELKNCDGKERDRMEERLTKAEEEIRRMHQILISIKIHEVGSMASSPSI